MIDRNILFVAMSLLLLTSCFQVKDKRVPTHDERFNPFIEAFTAEAQNRGVEFPEKMRVSIVEDLTEKTEHGYALGTCYYDRPRYIKLHPNLLKMEIFEIEKVVFHELGHCLLDREHTEELSIMNTSKPIHPLLYKSARKQFLDELFENIPLTLKDLVLPCDLIKRPQDNPVMSFSLSSERFELQETNAYTVLGKKLKFATYYDLEENKKCTNNEVEGL